MRIERAKRIRDEAEAHRAHWFEVLNNNELNIDGRALVAGLVFKYSRAVRAIEEWIDEVDSE